MLPLASYWRNQRYPSGSVTAVRIIIGIVFERNDTAGGWSSGGDWWWKGRLNGSEVHLKSWTSFQPPRSRCGYLWPNIHWISNTKPYSTTCVVAQRLILDRPVFFNLRKGGREDSAQRVDTIEIRRNTLYVAFDTVVFKVRRGLFDAHKWSARRMREGISAGWLSCISG